MTSALHSSVDPAWLTPFIVRQFAGTILRPAALTSFAAIDIDFASSAYAQRHWPEGMKPAAFLDGSKGRDVLIEADRHRAVKGHRCGSGFENPPGLARGKMVQRCWEALEHDHRTGWLDSALFQGFSVETFGSFQNVGERNPLSGGDIITIVPSRRIRYELHPKALIALLLEKQSKRVKGSKKWMTEQKQIDKLLARKHDSPVPGLAPTHLSYTTVLLSGRKDVRRQQINALELFLKSQRDENRSPFQRVEIIGELS